MKQSSSQFEVQFALSASFARLLSWHQNIGPVAPHSHAVTALTCRLLQRQRMKWMLCCQHDLSIALQTFQVWSHLTMLLSNFEMSSGQHNPPETYIVHNEICYWLRLHLQSSFSTCWPMTAASICLSGRSLWCKVVVHVLSPFRMKH